jgi:hypothetical protein
LAEATLQLNEEMTKTFGESYHERLVAYVNLAEASLLEDIETANDQVAEDLTHNAQTEGYVYGMKEEVIINFRVRNELLHNLHQMIAQDPTFCQHPGNVDLCLAGILRIDELRVDRAKKFIDRVERKKAAVKCVSKARSF